ncbi:hypothetical protein HPB52_000188 [Rhipicephalus sanguineus]|uniref:Uncharacterized protein n=1 Tax=Rhipicephalus sanguineus TaxID=34632 RepID=A0A9D4PTJ3_RHISA|nr:hypothetical protein HPB52_000188 [Rhipicephalus sanguineus]
MVQNHICLFYGCMKLPQRERSAQTERQVRYLLTLTRESVRKATLADALCHRVGVAVVGLSGVATTARKRGEEYEVVETRAALLSADANSGSSRGSRESSRSSHRYSTTSPRLSPEGCNLIIFRSWETIQVRRFIALRSRPSGIRCLHVLFGSSRSVFVSPLLYDSMAAPKRRSTTGEKATAAEETVSSCSSAQPKYDLCAERKTPENRSQHDACEETTIPDNDIGLYVVNGPRRQELQDDETRGRLLMTPWKPGANYSFPSSSSLDLAAALMYVDDVEAAVLQMRESGFNDIFNASTKAAEAAHTEMRMPRLTGRQLHRHNVPSISEAATLPMAEEFAALYSNIISASELQGELAVWAAKWKSEKGETRNMSAMQAVADCPETPKDVPESFHN